MNKSNWLIYAIIIVGLLGFLAIWFIVGNRPVEVFDIILFLIWALVVAACITAIYLGERRRKRRMMTVFLGKDSLYNPEAGVVEYGPYGSVIGTLTDVLDNMDYDEKVKPIPDMDFIYIIRTNSYSQDDSGMGDWTGEVAKANRPKANARPFNNKAELVRILSQPVNAAF